MWGHLLSRIDGTKEQRNLLCSPGPHTGSKGAKSHFYYVLALLHFDDGGQPAHYCDYNFQ